VSVVKDDRHKAREFLGDSDIIEKNEREILLSNSEAHRFAIKFHREKRRKFLS
jgi:excinuclease UvrABC nuclease subunit